MLPETGQIRIIRGNTREGSGGDNTCFDPIHQEHFPAVLPVISRRFSVVFEGPLT